MPCIFEMSRLKTKKIMILILLKKIAIVSKTHIKMILLVISLETVSIQNEKMGIDFKGLQASPFLSLVLNE